MNRLIFLIFLLCILHTSCESAAAEQDWIFFSKSVHAYHYYDRNGVISSKTPGVKRVGVRQDLTALGVEDIQKRTGKKATHSRMIVEISCSTNEARTIFVEMFNNKELVLKETKTTKWKIINPAGTNNILSEIVCSK